MRTPEHWTWRQVRKVWIGAVVIMGAIAWILPGLLLDWSKSDLDRALRPNSAFTLGDWSYGQHLRYEIVQPAALILLFVVIPAVVFAVTKRWLAAHASEVRSIPRRLQTWPGVSLAWLAGIVVAVALGRLTILPLHSPSAVAPLVMLLLLWRLSSRMQPRIDDANDREGAKRTAV